MQRPRGVQSGEWFSLFSVCFHFVRHTNRNIATTLMHCWWNEVVDWQETQSKWEEYEEVASSLLDWLQGTTKSMLDKNLPATFNELKVGVIGWILNSSIEIQKFPHLPCNSI